MKDFEKGTLITGLWQIESNNNKPLLIGRVGANLNAVVVDNPQYVEGGKNPKFLLYFFNGKQEDIKNYEFK
jgi:hypothetical protein